MHTAQRGNFRRFGLTPPVSEQPRSTGSGRQPAFNSRPSTTAPSRTGGSPRLSWEAWPGLPGYFHLEGQAG